MSPDEARAAAAPAVSSPPAACRLCGCSELNACAEGCSWAMPGICSSCVPQLLQPVGIETSLFALQAVHGNLCLALRHPENVGPSREAVEEFLLGIEQLLVETGVLSRELADEIRRAELEAQPRVILARG